MDQTFDEMFKLYAAIPDGVSSQTRARLLGVYAAMRLAKANEALALSISLIATNPIEVKTSTTLSGTVNANVKDIK